LQSKYDNSDKKTITRNKKPDIFVIFSVGCIGWSWIATWPLERRLLGRQSLQTAMQLFLRYINAEWLFGSILGRINPRRS
jgi:hypothetical protein